MLTPFVHTSDVNVEIMYPLEVIEDINPLDVHDVTLLLTLFGVMSTL